jgi:hypothetical protein
MFQCSSFIVCMFDILTYIPKALCRLIDNTNALARGQSIYNRLELQGVFAILFRFYLVKLHEMFSLLWKFPSCV